MPRRNRRPLAPQERTFLILGAGGVCLLAALQTLAAYRFGPVVPLLALPAVALATVIALRPIVGVAVGILAVPLELLNFRVGGAVSLSLAEVILFLTAVAYAVRVLVGAASIQRPAVAHIAFAVGLGVVATGLLTAEDTFVVVKILASWALLLLVSLAVANATPADIRLVGVATAISGGIVGAIALTGTGTQELVAGGAIATNRAQAGFAHPNVLAFFLVLAMPLALVLALVGRPRQLRPFMFAAAGLAVAGLALTLTRGAIIGALISLAVLLWWPPFRRLALVLLALLAVVSVLNFDSISRSKELSIVTERLSTLTRARQTSGDRVRIWTTTPGIVAEHPWLGVGEGNFVFAGQAAGLLAPTGGSYDHAHNVPLTIAAELGLIGLAVFVWFAVGVVQASAQVLRDRAGPNFPLGLALTAALAGLAGTSMTDYPPRTTVIMALILIEVGMLIGLARAPDTSGRRVPGPSTRDEDDAPRPGGVMGVLR